MLILQMFNNETTKPYPLNTTADNALWVGLAKTDNLPKYLKGYIGEDSVLDSYLKTVFYLVHKKLYSLPKRVQQTQ